MTTHELRTWPAAYTAVAEGRKTFEVRRNDRGFAVGDVLVLREWQPNTVMSRVGIDDGAYTGRALRRDVTYLIDLAPFGCPEMVGMQLGHDLADIRDLLPVNDSDTAVLETKEGRLPLRMGFDPDEMEFVVELPDGGRVRFASANTALPDGTP